MVESILKYKSWTSRHYIKSITFLDCLVNTSEDRPQLPVTHKICNSPIDEIITTNAIEPKPDALARAGKVTYLDVAPLIAEAMLCMHTGESISERLIFDNAR